MNQLVLHLAISSGRKDQGSDQLYWTLSMINFKLTCIFCWCTMSFWLLFLAKTLFSASLMFSFVRTVCLSEASFWAMQIVLSIFFNYFFTPFTIHSYSGWSLKILVAPYLYFIRRYLIIFFSSYGNTILLVAKNLIYK